MEGLSEDGGAQEREKELNNSNTTLSHRKDISEQIQYGCSQGWEKLESHAGSPPPCEDA